MNWHWLFEVLEQSASAEHLTLANPFKTRIIAEAQVKTDKIDARILALLLRAGLVSSVHIPCKEARQRKEVLRQHCFFVRQRTMLRNRIYRLLGAQYGLKLPQCSDLFGKKAWVSWRNWSCQAEYSRHGADPGLRGRQRDRRHHLHKLALPRCGHRSGLVPHRGLESGFAH